MEEEQQNQHEEQEDLPAEEEDGDENGVAGDDDSSESEFDDGTSDQDVDLGDSDIEDEPDETVDDEDTDDEAVDEDIDLEEDQEDAEAVAEEDDGKAPAVHELDEKTFVKGQLEAVLFVTDHPISAEEVSVKLNLSKKLVQECFEELAFDYIERVTSLEIAQLGDKFVLQIKPEYTNFVKKFASGGLIREAVMRTLTVIAAKQPILQSELSKLRSAAGEHIKELLEMSLVKAVKKGRSRELTTTDKFADMFGLSRDVQKMKLQIKDFLLASE